MGDIKHGNTELSPEQAVRYWRARAGRRARMAEQPRIVRYDEQTIEHVAWQLAEEDGFSYGRCALIDQYIDQVRDIIVGLEHAAELQDAGEFE